MEELLNEEEIKRVSLGLIDAFGNGDEGFSYIPSYPLEHPMRKYWDRVWQIYEEELTKQSKV